MKIGLFFGTFNPIHNGHVELAKNAIQSRKIDQIWFVITPQSPFKHLNQIIDKSHRFEMVTLALHQYRNLICSDIEFDLPNPQYTAQSLRHIQQQNPNDDFTIIMGSDNYSNISKWQEASYILNNFQILIYKRKGYSPGFVKNNVVLAGDYLDISSSYIRNNINTLDPNTLDQKVYAYIKQNALYG